MTNPERTSKASSTPTSEKPVRPSDASVAAEFWKVAECSYAREGVGLSLFRAVIKGALERDAGEVIEHFPAGDIGVGSYQDTVDFARENYKPTPELDASAPASGGDEPSCAILAQSLVECGRCLAVAEAKADHAAVEHWEGQIKRHVSTLRERDKTIADQAEQMADMRAQWKAVHEALGETEHQNPEDVLRLIADRDTKIARLRPNAERYLHMRNKESSLERVNQATGADHGASCYHMVDEVRELKWGDELDAAIDAAIGAQVPEGEK